MNIEEQYLKERIKYYPKNCDHIYERIKIRIIAQIKFLSHSKAIERCMENDDYKDVSIKGRSQETEKLKMPQLISHHCMAIWKSIQKNVVYMGWVKGKNLKI